MKGPLWNPYWKWSAQAKRLYWMVAGGIGVAMVAMLLIIDSLDGGKSVPSDTAPKASAEARAAAEKAGYKGKEAEQVGAAADRLCAASGEC